ncbi:monovalent cation/H(+) antiporter subunit G [Paenirhodobacter enshiensis]|uniref:monovalent cation/H(+) antiporter subunit G n=1 Tax=Paenirhodobacter enshiensis TaxID=1105367 RepID=UPI0035B154AA
MSGADLPLWAAVLIAALVVIGSTLTLIGAFGLLSLRSFYDRLHAPALGASWGTGAVILASMALFSLQGGAPQLHEIIIGVFVMVTTPVATMILGRAALTRDVADGLIAAPGSEPESETGDDQSPPA